MSMTTDELAERERRRRDTDAAEAEDREKKKMELEEVAVARRSNSPDWHYIVKAFEKEFNKKPESDGSLVFKTKEEAIGFFKRQAEGEEKRAFAACYTKNGKPTGEVLISIGNGELYSGTHNEVYEKLSAKLEGNPPPPLEEKEMNHCREAMASLVSLGKELKAPIHEESAVHEIAAERPPEPRGPAG